MGIRIDASKSIHITVMPGSPEGMVYVIVTTRDWHGRDRTDRREGTLLVCLPEYLHGSPMGPEVLLWACRAMVSDLENGLHGTPTAKRSGAPQGPQGGLPDSSRTRSYTQGVLPGLEGV